MLNKWIKISTLGASCCLLLTIGVGFGLKNEKYVSTYLETHNRVFELNEQDFQKIKKNQKLKIKLNDFVYWVKFKTIQKNKNKRLIALNLNYKETVQFVVIYVYLESVPIIIDLFTSN